MTDLEKLASKYVDDKCDTDVFYDAFIAGYEAALRIHGFSKQRDQLISFFNWYKDEPKELSNNETIVDAYLTEINCG